MSGAGVHRIDAGGRAYVLKISRPEESAEDWRQMAGILAAAAAAGVAPELIHADEARRATVTAFVTGESFLGYYFNPATRAGALADLTALVRRIHAIPVQPGWQRKDTRGAMRYLLGSLRAGGLPEFAAGAIERVVGEEPPPSDRPFVLSHNDLNPSNLLRAGERLMLLDWDQSAPNHPFYDLGGLALFLRMDDRVCCALLGAYLGEAVASLPPEFVYQRRLGAGFGGAVLLYLARQAGATGEGNVAGEEVDGLSGAFGRIRAGTLNLATPEGKWSLGLSFLKESTLI